MRNAGGLQVRSQSSGDKQAEHAEVAEQRPPRVSEGGRAIAFDQSVGRPRKSVAGKRHRQQRPSVRDYPNGQKSQRQRRADIVKGTRRRFAVLAEVKRPEFAVGFEPFRHAKISAVILLSTATERSLPHLLKVSQHFLSRFGAITNLD